MIDARLLDAVDALIAAHARQDRIPIIGVAGSQGSGKSTLAREAARRTGAACLSLDDVYLTRRERLGLAGDLHPLFATRGPPGTHDLALLNAVLDRLTAAGPGDRTPLPAFDKIADDRAAAEAWPVFEGRPAAILLEGWCLGACPQAEEQLAAPINGLEREGDRDGLWRRTINARLATDYATLFGRLDALLFLRAPSFEVVLDWRAQQEAGLLGTDGITPERRADLARFVQHFERLTRHMLAGGARADVVADLDPERRVLGTSQPAAR